MDANDLETMVDAYVVCAFWSSVNWDDMVNDNPQPMDKDYGPDDLAPDTLAAMREDCYQFWVHNIADLSGMDAGQAGHDFWLTRNSHGAGFWDRDLGELGDRLTDAAHVYGSVDLYVGDDGKVYAS